MKRKGEMIADTYVIKEVLGEGSSGEVFLVERVKTEMLYTMKTSTCKELLKREALIAGEIQSGYFPGFVDYTEDSERGYLILEYMEGRSLQELLDGGRHFSEKEILILLENITAALRMLHYHKRPIVHLDIKPANVIITAKGEVRIIDMGAGSVVGVKQKSKGGTYGYGAPEQFWQGTTPGPEADVYACGKLMAYLFTGKNPCEPPYDVEGQMLKSMGVKKCWRRIIKKCLEMEPKKRYPDGGILHQEIMKLQKEFWGGKRIRDEGYADIIYMKSIWKSDYERV